MKRNPRIVIAYCRSCHKCAKPSVTTLASAKPITKCALCHSLDIREATQDEAQVISEVPKVENVHNIWQ